jgi:glutamine synthetase
VEERTPEEVLQLISDEGVEVVDVRFCDLPGLMQHFSMPASQLTADMFEEGVGFDGPTPTQRSSTRSARARRWRSTASCTTR